MNFNLALDTITHPSATFAICWIVTVLCAVGAILAWRDL